MNLQDYNWEDTTHNQIEVGDILYLKPFLYKIEEGTHLFDFAFRYKHEDGGGNWSSPLMVNRSGFEGPGLKRAIQSVPYDPTQEPSTEDDI